MKGVKLKAWNVIFLLDKIEPSKILILKRSPTKSIAPNMYTGIGGKVEENETLYESAYRELYEEADIKDIKLMHFADIIISNYKLIAYFGGYYDWNKNIKCNEGDLEWTSVKDVLSKNIIPSTKLVLLEWIKRSYSLTEKWTIIAEELGIQNGVSLAKTLEVKSGFIN
jgi:8-oxo-dGTP pyrophosphatase MutT (NUDIX family)